MPKRSLNLHENAIESSEETDDDIDLTLEDYMEHPRTREIIENQHYWDFEYGLGAKLATMYRKHAYLYSVPRTYQGLASHISTIGYINDKEMQKDLLFMNFMYHHIYKDYKTDFIKNNELLQNTLLKDYGNIGKKRIEKIKAKSNLNVNSNKFDWATKTYK
tara:strand:- start:63 stop:545 length:483 start_codon:yes stop_codon:yes gene_type:complete